MSENVGCCSAPPVSARDALVMGLYEQRQTLDKIIDYDHRLYSHEETMLAIKVREKVLEKLRILNQEIENDKKLQAVELLNKLAQEYEINE